jgi:hypothetical protein
MPTVLGDTAAGSKMGRKRRPRRSRVYNQTPQDRHIYSTIITNKRPYPKLRSKPKRLLINSAKQRNRIDKVATLRSRLMYEIKRRTLTYQTKRKLQRNLNKFHNVKTLLKREQRVLDVLSECTRRKLRRKVLFGLKLHRKGSGSKKHYRPQSRIRC